MAAISLKKIILTAAAATVLAGAAAPAYAGGGRHHGHHGWAHGHYKAKKHYYYGHKPRHHHHHHYHHKRGLSGAEAGVIAAAIIGGAILIDAASDRRDDRYYGGYDDRYRDPYPPRYASRQAQDFYYRRDDSRYDDYRGYDDYDDELLGGDYGGPNTTYNYGAAYNDCKAETRAAADQGGLYVALPAKPQRITPIEGGEAVRFTADLIAQDRRGGEVKKTMICEAGLDGVRFLELV